MDRRSRIAVELLADRCLPSVVSPLPVLPGPIIPDPLPPSHQSHVTGDGGGSYTADTVISGAGPEYHLQGTADVLGLGHLRLAGAVHGVGFIAHGHAAGEITLADSHGTIVLALTGPDQAGFSPLPEHWSYRVEWATRGYKGVTGGGTLDLTLIPAPVAFGLPDNRGAFLAHFA